MYGDFLQLAPTYDPITLTFHLDGSRIGIRPGPPSFMRGWLREPRRKTGFLQILWDAVTNAIVFTVGT